ncbi:MAG TPA: Flp pilus assembly protein CpaB [Rhodospirillaceae bacterium]|jgi:pilus assembly protein CpaB|nr:Flp pilus assembly protein CpaB [Alphaproteobacteria bacterium]HBH26653.1 Flp pilus assembly protein CpaB [Rhodospirillaceae bacterium]
MNKQVIIVTGALAVVVLLVAVVVILMLGAKPPPKPEVVAEGPKPVPKTYVLVAARDLNRGIEPGAADLTWAERPEGEPAPLEDGEAPDPRDLTRLPLAAITGKDANAPTSGRLKGRLRRDVLAGEPVIKADMVQGDNVLSIALAPGMRAMTIGIDAEASVAGFIWPGDYVDVMLTYKYAKKLDFDDRNPSVRIMQGRTVGSVVSEVVLQNVRVLAIDQDAKKPAGEVGQVGKTVTLALTTQQAEVLGVAAKMGDLTLILRGLGDEEEVERDWPTPTDARVSGINEEMVQNYLKIKAALEEQGKGNDPVMVYEGGDAQKVDGGER